MNVDEVVYFETADGALLEMSKGPCCLPDGTCVDGELHFTEPVREYARRARAMKAAFLDNGFRLVYDNDLGEPLADGFYFTVAYPGYHCTKLLGELIRGVLKWRNLKTSERVDKFLSAHPCDLSAFGLRYHARLIPFDGSGQAHLANKGFRRFFQG